MKKEADWMAVILRVTFIIVIIGFIYGFDSAIGYSNEDGEKEVSSQIVKREMSSEEISHVIISDNDVAVVENESSSFAIDLNNNSFQNLIIAILTAIGLMIALLVFCVLASRI
ncbi:MAG: hypothetical protein KBG80_01190 [Breznakibacter sp.]|nr:hypothetical protein [Breznakibacter sp.]